jgi:Fe-S cluster assembly protein SufD
VVIQRFPDGVISHVTYRTRVDRGGSHRPFIVSLGGRLSKFDVGTLLAGDGSETELLGVVFGAKGQRFDHHTVHDHAARNTRSNLEMRVVLTDRAQSAYTGLIRIGESAPFAEAYQENRNLVLSKRAKAETIPELEISTDEVRCKHGATVGPVDEDQIFYLMSRGIPWTRAVRMIVRGFVDAVLDRAPTDLKAKIGETVEERLRHIS